MSKRKNHHFVPQFYFRRFSVDERSICALARSSGKTIPTASIKAQATVVGLCGRVQASLGALNYDLFVGTPVYEPASFPASKVVVGFQVAAQF